jgi:periplasmic divalent cation tolerance protein
VCEYYSKRIFGVQVEGEVEEAGECLLIIKTADDRIAQLVKRLPELHPYELPEVIGLEITDGLPSYLSWLEKETRPL